MEIFETAYRTFLMEQEAGRSAAGLERLQRGHGHAERLFLEQVWWPAVGRWDGLHAEYEVEDFRDGTRFLDFAYIRAPYRICFEIDGFGSHQRDVNRWQFTDHLNRQNHLVMDGWKVFRFSYDEIREHPRRCQQLLQQLLGRYYGNTMQYELSLVEREIVRTALLSDGVVRPSEIKRMLGVGKRQSAALLRVLTERGIFEPYTVGSRIHRYRLHPMWKKRFADL
ncbi:DNA-binding response regulator [Gorillibacterium sp. sgz5001074]|uniref:DNA-binding response regulator n=1 Tax=Gorillibacterium sp. sgz5001074 TaxID=3446695 RepID=UPI003F6642DD